MSEGGGDGDGDGDGDAWSVALTGSGDLTVDDIAVVGDALFLCGSYTSAVGPPLSLDFDAGREGFVARLDAVDGEVIWAEEISGPGDDDCTAIFANDSIVAIGGTVDQTATLGAEPLTAPGGTDAYIAILDHDGIPSPPLVFGISGTETILDLQVAADKVTVTGSTFLNGQYEPYVKALDFNGDDIGQVTFGNQNGGIEEYGAGVREVDDQLFASATVESGWTVSVPSCGDSGSTGGAQGVLLIFNTFGACSKGDQISGAGLDVTIESMAISGDSVFVGGAIAGEAMPGGFVPIGQVGAGDDGYVARFSTSLERSWFHRFGGDGVTAVVVDTEGRVIAGGSYTPASGVEGFPPSGRPGIDSFAAALDPQTGMTATIAACPRPEDGETRALASSPDGIYYAVETIDAAGISGAVVGLLDDELACRPSR